MGWFDRAKKSDRYNELSDDEKADMAKYAKDPDAWTKEQRANIVDRHTRKLNEQTAEYYDSDDSSSSSDYTPTDYSEYGDLSDQ